MNVKNLSISGADISIDRLSFFSAVINIYYSVHWSLHFYTGSKLFITESFIPQVLLGLSLLGFLNSRSIILLLINSILFATHYIYRSPVNSNNQTTAFFLSILVILSILKTVRSGRHIAIDRDKIHVENGMKQEILRMPG